MTVVGIRPDIAPEVDQRREMLDFLAIQIDRYVEAHGSMPHAVAIGLIGDPRDGNTYSTAATWAPGDEGSSRLHTASVASILFANHAMRRD